MAKLNTLRQARNLLDPDVPKPPKTNSSRPLKCPPLTVSLGSLSVSKRCHPEFPAVALWSAVIVFNGPRRQKTNVAGVVQWIIRV